MISNEKVLDRITVDLYNKRVFIRGEENSTVVFKCSTINELVEFVEKCKCLLNTNNINCW